ncbi:MAG: ArnT family glycosyltransferase [Planctomycetota bacterium]
MESPRVRLRGLGWIVLLALAATLRLGSVDFLLPHVSEPDGVVLTTQVELLETGAAHPERELNYGFYPLLVAGLTVAATSPGAVPPPDAPLAEHLRAASDRHVRIRVVVALLSLLAVPATWLVARRLLGAGGAWIAAAFVSLSFLSLWFAQQARPHAAATSFACIAVLAALRLASHGRPIDYVACGLAAALAIGSLQSGLAVLVPCAAAFFLRSERARVTSGWWSLATLAIVVASVPLFYPFLFAQSQGKDAAQLAVDASTLNLSGHLVALGLFNGAGFAKVYDALRGYEPWMSALGAAGIVLALAAAVGRRRDARATAGDRETDEREARRALLVVLAYALPYLIAIGLYQRTYQRFALPLVPFLACAAAYAVLRGASLLRLRSHVAFGAFALLCLAPQGAAALALARLRSAPDTCDRLADWMRAQTRASLGRVAILPTVDVPLVRSPRAMHERDPGIDARISPWYGYQTRHALGEHPGATFDIATMPMYAPGAREAILADPDAYVRGLGADTAVIEVFEHRAVLAAVRDALARNGRLVQSFSPDPGGAGWLFTLAYQDDEFPRFVPWMWRVLRARSAGPPIEVYALGGVR